MGEMLKKTYDVTSFKHGIWGKINDYGVVIKLNFAYKDKEVEIALSRPFPDEDNALLKLGQETINSYVDNLVAEEEAKRRLMLHYWYVNEVPYGDQKYTCAHGIVSGHKRLEDATFIHTSAVERVEINTESAEAMIRTKNSVYYCPLE